jgi:hypothetical protein
MEACMVAHPPPESAAAPRPVHRAPHCRCAAYAPPRPWSSRRRGRSKPAPPPPRARGREEAQLSRAPARLRWSGARREESVEKEAQEGEQPVVVPSTTSPAPAATSPTPVRGARSLVRHHYQVVAFKLELVAVLGDSN